MHLFNVVYVCMYSLDFMLNVWSSWEEEYEFQLFLFLRTPSKSVVRVRKECIDEILSFISENLRRDTIVLIPIEVQI
jgi:hypothetical protein